MSHTSWLLIDGKKKTKAKKNKTKQNVCPLNLQRISQNLSTALVIKPLKILVKSHSDV